jgi:di/tripeptidase
MSATLFDLNPYLKKRFEWIEELRHNTGMPDLPLDPTHFTNENLPPKTLPSHMDDLPKEERKKKKIDTVEI